MDPVSLNQLPRELFAIIGVLVVMNIGVLINWIRSKIKKEVEFALVQQQIQLMNVSMGEVKATVNGLQNQILEILKNK